MARMQSLLRMLPAVHRLLTTQALVTAGERFSHEMVVRECRAALADLRQRITDQKLSETEVAAACNDLPEMILARLETAASSAYPAVINATGVLIHTNLGRAPLGMAHPPQLASYLALEYDITCGRRGQRLAPLRQRLAQLFEAESAVMVNNNAAALLLQLKAHAEQQEVIVSRGELIEIGGSFRLPEVMAASGARLREVGCTNRTHLADYERAIGEQTAAIMIAHRSNFTISGFTTTPETQAIADLAHKHDLPLLVDQGSGNLYDLRRWGLPHEATVKELLTAGADLVCFSGDKLLGGPQAGIVVGSQEWVEPLARHPMYRALRSDKTTLVWMDQVLQAHASGQLDRIPLYAMLDTPIERLKRRARSVGRRLRADGVPARGCVTRAALGGGTTPTETIPSYGLALVGGQELADRLRMTEPPVVARIDSDRVILDLRTVLPSQDQDLAAAVRSAVLAGDSAQCID
jgi:L-seryl-tRNA(Ser) seleniumtransferase